MEVGFLRGPRRRRRRQPTRPRPRRQHRGTGRERRAQSPGAAKSSAPYVAGIPIGRVSSVRAVRDSSPRRRSSSRSSTSPRSTSSASWSTTTPGATGPDRGRSVDHRRRPLMPVVRALALTLLVLLAVVLQVSVFGHLSYDGVVPNLALLVVVAAALARGPEFAAMLGFISGPGDRPRTARRPHRRPLGARARPRRLPRRPRPPRRRYVGRGGDPHRRGLLLRRHLDLRAERDAARRPGDPRRSRR